ncbi:hypothetical protein FGLOB1_407 [Fusarium globosum]|uniref:Uncharacterized protein n=1 Tax=Fusarium globosum TaxID=78864 RepID=A0A8H6DKR8_9HYPO|nr:hypothetical protein FGLOB1_407 [Fusarium globosum]
MGFKDTQDYELYTSMTGGRPDEKLPPLDFKDGSLHLVPGEVWCRWREDISGIICNSDLPRGSYSNQLDYQSAVRLTRLFNKHSPDMPPKVGEGLRDLLVSGAFQHTGRSDEKPIKHQLSKEMFDAIDNEPKWMNITYERWFILVGVYGVKTLRQECQGIVDAVLTRCGEELDRSLAYQHGPDDSKPHFSVLITQMSDTIAKQQKEIDHLKLAVGVEPDDN